MIPKTYYGGCAVKRMKRPLSILLTVIMLFSLLPVSMMKVKAQGSYTVSYRAMPIDAQFYHEKWIKIHAEVNGEPVEDGTFTANAGDEVRIYSAVTEDYYPFNVTGISVITQDGEEETATELETTRIDRIRNVEASFIMPENDVDISFEVNRVYKVIMYSIVDGEMTADVDRAIGGDTVTLTPVVTDPVKTAVEINVCDEAGHEIATDGLTFVMPQGNVRVFADFRDPNYVPPGIPYNYREWDGEKVVTTVYYDEYMTDISTVTDNKLHNHEWYYVSGNVTFSKRLEVEGEAHLVLLDGSVLTCKNGIEVGPYDRFSVYDSGSGTGKLVCDIERFVDKDDQGEAAIGGNWESSGDMTFYGGNIEAVVHTAGSGAAIGGGEGGAAGRLIFYAGNYTVKNYGGFAAAIGGGYRGEASGCDGEGITFYGGTFFVHSYSGGAGIGGGEDCNCNNGSIAIYGGEITVESVNKPAGIGGGCNGTNPRINIYDGEITVAASGSKATGAGIGSGYGKNQTNPINIIGGTVAVSSTRGAGIGGSCEHNSGVINIYDGVVVATSSQGGAGIGGGYKGSGGTTTVYDGIVVAGSSFYDSTGDLTEKVAKYLGKVPRGKVKARRAAAMMVIVAGLIDLFSDNEYCGAGIGGGMEGSGGTVNINGGTVTATCGLSSADAIGTGKSGKGSGDLNFAPEMLVHAGGDEDHTTLASAGSRVSACRNNKYCLIETCEHEDLYYSNEGEEGHAAHCSKCAIDGTVYPHVYEENELICDICGYERIKVTLEPGDGDGEEQITYLNSGDKFTLPSNPFTAQEGKTFCGWKKSGGSSTDIYPVGSEQEITANTTYIAQWTDPFKVWVNDVQVTEANKDDILGDGKASYDPETSTLNLEDVTFSGTSESAFVYAEKLDLTVTGSAVFNCSYTNGIRIVGGSLTLDGDFTVNNGVNCIFAERDVILRSGTLIANNASSFGIRANRVLYIRKGMERVEASSNLTHALYGNNDIIVDPELVVTSFSPESAMHVSGFAYSEVKTIVLEHVGVVGHSLSLNGNIGVNYYIDIPDELAENSTVSFSWFDKELNDVPLEKDPVSGSYRASCPVAVAEMTYDITATISIEGFDAEVSDVFSAEEYADFILTDEEFINAYKVKEGTEKYNKLANLVKSMLDIGGKSQLKFDRNTGKLANRKLTSSDPESVYYYTVPEGEIYDIPYEIEDMTQGLSDFGLEYNGFSVVYLSGTSLRLYYKIKDAEAFDSVKDDITYNGEKAAYTVKGSGIYFEIKEIAAPDLDRNYVLSINGTDYTCSVLDYVFACIHSDRTDENMKDLAIATYMYNLAAEEYYAG